MSALMLMRDAQARPELFRWNGAMDPAALGAWVAANPWLGYCPSDLMALWQDTGGGEVFETETILGPLGDRELGDDIASVNRELHSRGVPERFLVFHVGFVTCAVDTESRDYVEMEASGSRVLRRFSSLDDWYGSTLRAEYRDRYGLP